MKTDTRGFAFANVVVKAFLHLALLHPLGCDGSVAEAYLIEFSYQFHHGIERACVAEGAVVGSCLLVDVACLDDSREVFVGDADRRVGFPVLQQYVVEWLVLLDEIVLLDESVFIGRHNDILDVFYLADENLCLAILEGIVEVRTDAPFEVLCLAYVDNRAIFI